MSCDFEVLTKEVLEVLWNQTPSSWEENEVINAIIEFIDEKSRRDDMVQSVLSNDEAMSNDDYEDAVKDCSDLQEKVDELEQKLLDF